MKRGNWGGRKEEKAGMFEGGEQLVREIEKGISGKLSCRFEQTAASYILHASDIAHINTCSLLLEWNKTSRSPRNDKYKSGE